MIGDAKASNRPRDFVAPLRAAAMAGMLVLGAWSAPAQAATDLYSVISSGNGNAGLVTVDAATGQLLGGHYFQQSGSEFAFDRIGGIAFAPDGTLYSVISSGNGNAGLVTVDPATGELLGGHYFQQSGSEFTFDRIGDIAFAPDGTLYSVISSGNGNAGLVTVDAATGQLLGGHYFQQSGSEFAFDRIGGIAFAPDGTLYSVISSGNGNAGLVTVDPATGELLGGHYFQQSGSEFTFDRIGDIAFAPDGTLHSVISSGNGNAGLVTVDAATGQLLGGHYFQQSGSEFAFDRIGDIAFAPELAPIGGAVPEPATWAMLICGLGMVGATMRRRAAQGRIAQAA